MENKWDVEITPKTSFFKNVFPELIKSRNLIYMLVKRDFKTMYKQTVLGPLWLILRPLMSAGIFTLVFSYIAKLSTNNVPDILFYMSGSILWTMFSGILLSCSSVFLSNYHIFSKVYFQRLAVPFSTALSRIFVFFIRLLALLGICGVYILEGAEIVPNLWVLLTPVLLAQTALLAIGIGIICASVTVRYRDLSILVSFGVSLLMYLTPIVYPISQVPESFKGILMLNPMTPVVESLRYGLFSTGELPFFYLLLSLVVTVVIFMLGAFVFNKAQKNFVDSI